MRPSNNMENKIPSGTYWRGQLVYTKVLIHSSLEPALEYNQDKTLLTNQSSLWSWELTKYYAVSDEF